MTYSIRELFYTLAGEGAQAGRPAVFCRFAGCNLWSGREKHRLSAICRFCDTDFLGVDGEGGGKFTDAEALADAITACWPREQEGDRYVVCTGGEPLLQLDKELIDALHRRQFEVAIETNGTLPTPRGVDWVCVSPKAGSTLKVRNGHELKLVYPQEGAEPDQYVGLDFEHFYLQPMAGTDTAQNTRAALDYCLANPRWRLSLQIHKLLGIP